MDAKLSRDENPSIEQKRIDWPREDFISLYGASCWVAFKSFDKQTTLSPTNIFTILDGGILQQEEIIGADAKYWMAHDQVASAIKHGILNVFGRLMDAYNDNPLEAARKPSDTLGGGMIGN